MFNRSLIESILPPIVTKSVAHYTRIGTLCHFLPPVIPPNPPGWASAWATPVQFLNDRMELVLGLKVLDEAANLSSNVKPLIHTAIIGLLNGNGPLDADAFQMSSSGDPDNLGQWRGYASNGMGCSVVTNTRAVHQAGDVAGWVLYNPQKQMLFATNVLNALNQETDFALIEQTLTVAASFMKHTGFSAEKEFRLIVLPELKDVKFRESSDRLVPFVDFLQNKPPLPIKRIIIGPGWQLSKLPYAEQKQHHVVQAMNRLLAARQVPSVDIVSSSTPYDPR